MHFFPKTHNWRSLRLSWSSSRTLNLSLGLFRLAASFWERHKDLSTELFICTNSWSAALKPVHLSQKTMLDFALVESGLFFKASHLLTRGKCRWLRNITNQRKWQRRRWRKWRTKRLCHQLINWIVGFYWRHPVHADTNFLRQATNYLIVKQHQTCNQLVAAILACKQRILVNHQRPPSFRINPEFFAHWPPNYAHRLSYREPNSQVPKISWCTKTCMPRVVEQLSVISCLFLFVTMNNLISICFLLKKTFFFETIVVGFQI